MIDWQQEKGHILQMASGIIPRSDVRIVESRWDSSNSFGEFEYTPEEKAMDRATWALGLKLEPLSIPSLSNHHIRMESQRELEATGGLTIPERRLVMIRPMSQFIGLNGSSVSSSFLASCFHEVSHASAINTVRQYTRLGAGEEVVAELGSMLVADQLLPDFDPNWSKQYVAYHLATVNNKDPEGRIADRFNLLLRYAHEAAEWQLPKVSYYLQKEKVI